MDLGLLNRAGNFYTNLLEQGVNKATAGEHTRQRFGLNDDQLRYVMAHNFLLTNVAEGDAFEEGVSDLMQAYAEVVRTDVPYYGD